MGRTAMKGGVHEDSHEGGNSVSVRITASVMAAAAVSIDQAVEISEQDGHTIIEPSARQDMISSVSSSK